MQISERLCTCSLSKGPVLVTEHQNVFFLTQHRVSRSGPVVHPSPRSSIVSLGAVADPARPGNGNLADTHPQSLGEGKRKSQTKQHHRALWVAPAVIAGSEAEAVVPGGRAEGLRCPGGCGRRGLPLSSLCWPGRGDQRHLRAAAEPRPAPALQGFPSLLPPALGTDSMEWCESAALKEGRRI